MQARPPQVSSETPFPGAGWPSDLVTGEGEQETALGIKSSVPLRTAGRQAIYNGGYCCLSCDVKVSRAGKRSWKLICGENALPGKLPTESSGMTVSAGLLSSFCWMRTALMFCYLSAACYLLFYFCLIHD